MVKYGLKDGKQAGKKDGKGRNRTKICRNKKEQRE